MPCVAGEDVGAGKAFMEEAGQLGIVLDSHEFFLAQAMPKERLGDHAGAGAEFEHEAFRVGGQPVGHGRSKMPGTGHNRAGATGMGKPFLQEQCRVAQSCQQSFGHGVRNNGRPVFF